MPTEPTISAIVPARNEEANIADCIRSIALQPEVLEILVVNDQSADRTAEIVRNLIPEIPHLRLLETSGLPSGWVGKNNAVWLGAQNAKGKWLLFTDADATLAEGATAKAFKLAEENSAALVSFSPEQTLKTWYEKALIPFVYCRLARKFSYKDVNDPKSPAAAANGQFLLIQKTTYDAIGGHAAVAGEVLEDVALARRVKQDSWGIWFGPGDRYVSVRMYRSFSQMWAGWRKNLYQLMANPSNGVFNEFESAFPWMTFVILLFGLKFPLAMFVGVVLLLFRQISYGLELARNQFPFKFIIYYIPAVFLYAGVLLASHRSYARGKVAWKGREYPVGIPNTSSKG
ncbi:MAG TPA: glycosyltransferase family 2 protein [Candidatus Dormibacteraeota bacterium]|jgi:glycosyltransferase involved in cell wall biosynthesis|nr:glycosyltransferase family 2 protein [Candidatus Dormibacteraeota bacterium]